MSKNIIIDGRTLNGVTALKATDADTGNLVSFPDTSDANAIASDILSGKSAYVNGVKVNGTNTGVATNDLDGLVDGTITVFVMPSGKTTISQYRFYQFTSLTSANMGGAKTIGQYAFDGCTRLANVSLPVTLTSIGAYAFRSLGNGQSTTFVLIPENACSVGTYAFNGSKIQKVAGKYSSIGTYAFAACNSLNKVGLNDYGKRLPYELSGGERQRVAIARQLAKGVKLLLADEPTGNLDSENGENVINILKELSKELTVVVVSHDMDFASRYADRIITIKDGKIEHISDDCQLTTNSERLPYKSVKPHFPFKFVRKFAAKNIFKKKIRFIIAAFLSIISFALFSVLGSILTVDPERSLSEQLIADEPNTYIAYQAYYADNDANEENILQFFGDKELENEYIEAFNGEYDIPYFNIYKGDRNSTIGLISSAEDIKNILGYELLDGYLPLDEDSAYITDYYAKLMIARKRQYIEDGVQKTFEKDAVFNDFIGKKIVISGDSVGSSVSYFTIAGIIITDYDTYEYPELNPENMNSQVGNSNEYSVSGKKRDDIYNVCYFNFEGMRKRMADNILVPMKQYKASFLIKIV